MYDSFGIDERELVQVIQLPHAPLVFLQGSLAVQVVIGQEADSDIYVVDLAVQVVRDDLLSPAGQLIQIVIADGTDRILRILLRRVVHEQRSGDQYGQQDYSAYHDCNGYTLFLHIHPVSSSPSDQVY